MVGTRDKPDPNHEGDCHPIVQADSVHSTSRLRTDRREAGDRNRETGAVTFTQALNFLLYIVIVASVLWWVELAFRQSTCCSRNRRSGGLLVWAADEGFLGVNPRRRRLGAAFRFRASTIATYTRCGHVEAVTFHLIPTRNGSSVRASRAARTPASAAVD